jgi:hypothetical protein
MRIQKGQLDRSKVIGGSGEICEMGLPGLQERRNQGRGGARSTGGNEKTLQSMGLGGVVAQSETGFANVIGGEGGIRTLVTAFTVNTLSRRAT